jgi:hypothetical protein
MLSVDRTSQKRTVVVQVLGSPHIVVTLSRPWGLCPAVLVNLEELARSISTGGILDLSHIRKYRAPVSATNTLCGT